MIQSTLEHVEDLLNGVALPGNQPASSESFTMPAAYIKKNRTSNLIQEFSWKIPRCDSGSYTISFEKESGPTCKSGVINWINKFVHLADKQRVISKFEDYVQCAGDSVEEDVFRVYSTAQKKYCWIFSRYHMVCEGEHAAYISGTSIDISQTKQLAFDLNSQQEQYDFLVQNLGQTIFSLDKHGQCIYLSQAWKNLLGYDPAQSHNRSFIQYLGDDHVQLFWIQFGGLLSGARQNFDEELQLVHANGERIWVRIVAKSLRDVNNRITGVFGTIDNINEKYNAGLLLHENNEKLNTILNNSKEILLTINMDKRCIENVNEAVAILGYSVEEWKGKSVRSWPDDQRRQFHELMKLSLKSELQIKNQQITFANKTNTENITFEFSTSLFYYKREKYLLCVLRDVRERLSYEENLSRLNTQLSHLLNNIDDVYAIYDLTTNSYDFVSDNVEALYCCEKSHFIKGELWKEVIYKEDLPSVEKQVNDIIAKGGKGEIFYRITSCSGDDKMILEKVVVGKDAEGNSQKLYIVKTDYTHIDQAEKSLMETERKFRFISENIRDFISIHDPDWNFTYASPSVVNVLGYQPEDVVGIGAFDLVHPDDLLRTFDEALEPTVLAKVETQVRYRMLAKNGTYKWMETYSKPVINSKGQTASIISSTRDVTDQVNAEVKLKDSEEKYRLLSENSNDIISVHDLDGRFIYISPSVTQVLGYSQSELLNKKPSELFHTTAIAAETSAENFSAVILKKQTRKYINKVLTKWGDIKMMEVWLQPVLKDNEIISIQASTRDVTERENLLNELEHSLAKERQLNELRSMFVSTASHQFRTPLTVIQSGVEIMEMYLEDLPDKDQQRFQRQFSKIQTEIERLQYLMSDVLLLGRADAARTPFNPGLYDLIAFCQEIIDKYNVCYPDDRKIILSIEGSSEPVMFDDKLLGHAIENILSNAYKYSTEGNLHLQVIFAEEKVRINIADKGIGIPEEDVKNMFQPFYRATNTDEIEGTGLGLAIVKEFVDKHHGEIFLTSKVNKGTTVSVIIPVKQNEA